MRFVRSSLYAVAAFVVLAMAPQSRPAESASASCGEQCGQVRWTVKVLAHGLDSQVRDVVHPPVTDIAALNLLHVPVHRPADAFAPPDEGHAVDVSGCLWYLAEQTGSGGDLDFHLAMADLNDPSKTLIAEIPNSACELACGSSFAPRYAIARQHLLSVPQARSFLASVQLQQRMLDAKLGGQRRVARGIMNPPVRIRVKGVKFFDRSEHGIGHSDTGIEVHPVYDLVKLDGGCNAPPKGLIERQFQLFEAEFQRRGYLD